MSKHFLQGTGPVAQIFATVFYTADVLWSVGTLKSKDEGIILFVRYTIGTAYLPRALAPYGYRFFRNLLPFPDLALFIDIDPKVALRRIAKRGHAREMFETLERLEAVRAIARRLVSKEWVVVDNSEDGEGPFKEVERILVARSLLRPAL